MQINKKDNYYIVGVQIFTDQMHFLSANQQSWSTVEFKTYWYIVELWKTLVIVLQAESARTDWERQAGQSFEGSALNISPEM